MGHKDASYVIFDGTEDKWAYAYMLGWKKSDKVDFDFNNAHDLDNMTSNAQSEDYVKKHLRGRLARSAAAVVLIGEKTKNLHKFVRWEQEEALNLDLPIIAANLNGSRRQDDRCPPVIRDKCVIHVTFQMKIIKYALDKYVPAYRRFDAATKAAGARHYSDAVYESLGL